MAIPVFLLAATLATLLAIVLAWGLAAVGVEYRWLSVGLLIFDAVLVITAIPGIGFGAIFLLLFGLLLLKRSSRVRGSGWLICPNCHEHASHDVVDELIFLGSWWLRLTPIHRTRFVVCRKCSNRRLAGNHSLAGWVINYDDEMSHLETAGQPIHRAWLFPVGLIGLILVAGTCYDLILAPPTLASNSGITLIRHPTSGDLANPNWGKAAGPISLLAPSTFEEQVDLAATPPISWSDTSGANLSEAVVRDNTVSNLQALVAAHFSDEAGLSDVGFPAVPSAGTCTSVGGQTAYTLTMNFSASGQPAVVLLWAVMHEGVGYVFSFTGDGDSGIQTISAMAHIVMASVSFTGKEPQTTPSPGLTSPSPSASPSASANPTATASPQTSPGSGPSPSPTAPTINCS